MEVEIRDRPSFGSLHVALSPGDRIVAEADAMASMSGHVEMSTRFSGGFFSGLTKRLFGKESLFINEFTVSGSPGELVLSQTVPGDIEVMELRDQTLFLQPGAFIAAEPGVELGVGWAGFASFVGREGLFRLKVSGTGRVWFGGYGGIYPHEVTGEHIVDTGHLVAYEPGVELGVALSGGLLSSFFGGEGLVTRVSGRGRVFLQSRSVHGLASWTNRFLR